MPGQKQVDDKLYKNILEENIRLHALEAECYERLHPEEFNWFEQKQVWKDLEFIRARLGTHPKALDLGCGTGNIAFKLIMMDMEVCGVDISKEMLEVFRGRLEPKFKDKATLINQDIDTFLQGAMRKYDIITIHSALHHLPNYLSTLARALVFLNQGGFIYISHEPTKTVFNDDPKIRTALWQFDFIIYAILHFGRRPKVEGRSWRVSDYHLYHGFDEDRVLQCVEKADFKMIKFLRYASTMRLGVSCWIDTKFLRTKAQFRLIAQKI